MIEGVGNHRQYDAFADDFLDHAEDGFFNAHYDRPACLALMGDVDGLDVLDAACGPGLYAAELVERGARTTGCDSSERMIELFRLRVPQARAEVHDLARPLQWLEDQCMDVVLLALALEYLDDRVAVLRELHRVLRPGGAMVLSVQHPTGDWLRHGGSYFDDRVVEETWSRGWVVRYWISPLERTSEALYQAGFLIERLVEPRPLPSARAIRPDKYDELVREPTGFLAIRARRAD